MLGAGELWRKRLHLPAYRLGEAATYSRVSPQTILDWEKRNYCKPAALSHREAKAGFSFLQLIELAVVAEMRRIGVSLSDIRAARDFLSKKWEIDFPFAILKFKSDGVDILVDHDWETQKIFKDKLISANRGGQYIWPFAVETRLKEFNYGADGVVDAWKVNGLNSEIEISPRIAFGAPNVHGIATAAIKQRWKEGMSLVDIAEDLEIAEASVVDALKFEGVTVSSDRGRAWTN